MSLNEQVKHKTGGLFIIEWCYSYNKCRVISYNLSRISYKSMVVGFHEDLSSSVHEPWPSGNLSEY